MKPYFIINETPYNLRHECALNYHQEILRIMELTHFLSEHVYCGISYHSL